MKESFIKFIIIALVAFFSVSMAYAEADYNKPIWNKVVTIGYELDHFSPTKVDTTNVKDESGFLAKRANKQYKELQHYIKEGNEYKDRVVDAKIKMIGASMLFSVSMYLMWACVIFIFLTLMGVLLLMVVKGVKKYKINVN